MTDELKPQPGEVQKAEGPFQTAAEAHGMTEDMAARHVPGLSFTPGLKEVPDSPVPFTVKPANHVYGSQQSAVDPHAAGLDVNYAGLSRAENRVVNLTGETASGPRTLLEKHPPEDGSLQKAPTDEEAGQVPGPTSALPK